MDQPDETEKQEPMSDAVASAWADVIISIHERLGAEEYAVQREAPCGPGVAAALGSRSGDLTSLDLAEAQP
jgi:hypothetical protein